MSSEIRSQHRHMRGFSTGVSSQISMGVCAVRSEAPRILALFHLKFPQQALAPPFLSPIGLESEDGTSLKMRICVKTRIRCGIQHDVWHEKIV